MSYQINFIDLRPDHIQRAADERVTPFGQFLGAFMAEGFSGTMPGMAATGTRLGAPASMSAEGRRNPLMDPELLGPSVVPDAETRGISREEWEASPWWREDLEFDPFMTAERAQVRADLHDEIKWRQWLIGQRRAGVFGLTAGFAAGVVGSAPDPLNFVPLVGPAWRAAWVARGATRGARVLRSAGISAAEAGAANLAYTPFVASMRNYLGDDYGLYEAAIDTIVGAAIGGTVGGIGGYLAGRRAMRPVVDDAGTVRGVEARDPLPLGFLQMLGADDLPAARFMGEPDSARPGARLFAMDGTSLDEALGRLNIASADLVTGRIVDVTGGEAPRPPAVVAPDAALVSPRAYQEHAIRQIVESQEATVAHWEAALARGETNENGLLVGTNLRPEEVPERVADVRRSAVESVERLRAASAETIASGPGYREWRAERYAAATRGAPARAAARVGSGTQAAAEIPATPGGVPARIAPAVEAEPTATFVETWRPLSDPSPGTPPRDFDAEVRVDLARDELDVEDDSFEMALRAHAEERGSIGDADAADLRLADSEVARMERAEDVYAQAAACIIRGAA